jgi:hypothetical protein
MMSRNGVEELGMGHGNGNEVGELRLENVFEDWDWGRGMGIRMGRGNGFGESEAELHAVGKWEWGCGLEMDLKKRIGVVDYILGLGSGNRAGER